MNNKAQLFTLDLLLALIPLTLVIAMSANAMSGVITQMQEYSSIYSFQRTTNDALDVLVKTPGLPVDWGATGNASMIGLAAWDSTNNRPISNYFDGKKYYQLNFSLTKLTELIGTSNYNITLTIHNISSFNTTNLSIPEYGVPVPDNAAEVVAVERIVIMDNLLALKSASPSGLGNINNTERGGGATESCADDPDDSISLSQGEIDNFQFWFQMSFSPSPSSMIIRFNNGCADPQDNCNSILTKQDFPISSKFNLESEGENEGWTNSTSPLNSRPEKDVCGGGTVEVIYWTNVTDLGGADEEFTMYVKVPKEFLVVGSPQVIYVWLNGVTTIDTGWIATSPRQVTRDQLEDYFGGVLEFDDVPVKIKLQVWR